MLAGFTHQPVVELSGTTGGTPTGLGHRVLWLGRRVGRRDCAENELSLLAQLVWRRKQALSFSNGYHGETLGALGVTDGLVPDVSRAAIAPLVCNHPAPTRDWRHRGVGACLCLGCAAAVGTATGAGARNDGGTDRRTAGSGRSQNGDANYPVYLQRLRANCVTATDSSDR